jgi:murein L,D-transpeptidase YcbB/YkuD
VKIILIFFIFVQLVFSSPQDEENFIQDVNINEEINTTLWTKKNLNELLKLIKDPTLNYLDKDYNRYKILELLYDLDIANDIRKHEIEAKLDTIATDAYIAFARDLSIGLIDWDKFQNELNNSEVDLVWENGDSIYNYKQALELALKTDMLTVLMYRYMPPDKGYRELIKAYHRYKKLKFPEIDYGKVLKIGDYGYRTTQIKKFLVVSGDLKNFDKAYLDFPRFDKKLEDAIKRFQKRHYLKVTGELDRVTVLYTKTTVEDKLKLIKLNIERYKILPHIYEKEYILINIPEFSLKYFRYGELIDDIFVVVGREDRPTPIFSDVLEYIVLNPSWIVPQNLIRKDYIPQLIQNPMALEDHHIYIHKSPSRLSKKIDTTKVNWEKYLDPKTTIPYFFMQYPGEDNVLGKMKFIFPNKYKVYLHDTNSKDLTTLKYRLYSSGCIRLSKPYDLLSIVAENSKYSMEELLEKLESKKTVNIPLKTKIPIHVRYNTVFVNRDGDVEFRRDFYGLDKIQLKTLKQ